MKRPSQILLHRIIEYQTFEQNCSFWDCIFATFIFLYNNICVKQWKNGKNFESFHFIGQKLINALNELINYFYLIQTINIWLQIQITKNTYVYVESILFIPVINWFQLQSIIVRLMENKIYDDLLYFDLRHMILYWPKDIYLHIYTQDIYTYTCIFLSCISICSPLKHVCKLLQYTKTTDVVLIKLFVYKSYLITGYEIAVMKHVLQKRNLFSSILCFVILSKIYKSWVFVLIEILYL